MKNYRKENYRNDDAIYKRLEEINKGPLRFNDELRIMKNLKIIDYFLEHPHMTNVQLGQYFSISSSSVGRYLKNEKLLKEFYLPGTIEVIDEALNRNRIEGRKKNPSAISDEEIRLMVEDYMKEGESLSTVGEKHGMSKDAVYRRITSDKVMSVIGKEKYYFLKEKLQSKDLEHKYLEKQSRFIEEKEIIEKKGDKDTALLARQVEQQKRTMDCNYDSPRLSQEDATRFRISEKVKGYAQKFIDSKDSYADTCLKYGVQMDEMAELFFSVLANVNMDYYMMLVNKYPYLREFEELKLTGRNRKNK